jgi:uncharacterized membrane protein
MNLAVEFVYAIGSLICHQLPERSFFLGGQPLPVCARCTGLYLSGAAGAMGWLAWKVARGWRPIELSPGLAVRLVGVGSIPTAVTVATAMAGIWDGSNAVRALLAIPLGVSAGGVVASVLTKDLR